MNRELPERKPIRLKNFDYSSNGAYFITICAQNRKDILSAIVGEGFPLPQLSCCGEIVDKWIQRIPEKYPEIYHVVRNYDDYLEINKYIYNDPRHWYLDELYTED